MSNDMTRTIRFGTSGWRAIIAEDFTFANVRLVTEAIARYVKQSASSPTLLIGYDTRFASDDFARQVAHVLSASAIKVLLSSRPVPTPAVSLSVRHRRLDGAVNITASHNPGEYNGMKFSGSDGAPALPDVTEAIEAEITKLQDGRWEFEAAPKPELIENVDIRDEYLEALAAKVDLEAIRKSDIRIGYDPLHGVGAGYLDHLLEKHGLHPYVLHDNRDVYFGGDHPEPDERNLGELKQAVLDNDLTLGLGTDGDADRFGILDSNGDYVYPNEIIALLLDYLVESRGWKGAVARTVATTHLIDRVAELHDLEVLETPVGFKYIGEYIEQGRIILGGEESAGLAIRGHLPEKDGILACLLVAEMVAQRGKSLTSLLKILFERTGEVYNRRLNIRLEPSTRKIVDAKIAANISEFFGRKVDRVDRTDGLKLIFEDGSWVLARGSGTEPVIRYYAEAGSRDALEQLLDCGRRWTTEA